MTTTHTDRALQARRLAAAVAGFLLVTALIVRASDAAFTAEHVNDGNAFATAVIDLDGLETPLFGDPADGAAFNAVELYPGGQVTGCIDITYAGPLGSDDLDEVTVAAEDTTDALTADLQVAIDVLAATCADGDAGGARIADGVTLAGLGPLDSGWTPDGTDATRGFRFAVTLDPATEAQMGDSASGITLAWRLDTATN